VDTARKSASSPLTFDELMRRLRARHFAVLATVDDQGAPHASAITYAASPRRMEFFAMTRRHLAKARNLRIHRDVALVVPLPRRVLRFVPPPTVQFRGTAEVLEPTDTEAQEVFRSFLLGRAILKMYAALERRGETRTCFLRITPGPVMFAYGVGVPVWRLVRRMDHGIARVELGRPAVPQ